MAENFDEPVQVATFSNSLSSSSWSNMVESAEFLTYCQVCAQNEIDLGMDRDRQATGQIHELLAYEMFSANSFRFSTMVSSLMTAAEGIVRAAKPGSVLSVGGAAFLPVIASAGFSRLAISNDVHLDAMERFWTGDIGDFSLVPWQDIAGGMMASTYDCIIVFVPSVAHDVSILKNLVGSLNPGGTMVMLSATDHGNLFKYRENHDFFATYTELQQLEGCSFSLIPSGLGIGVLTKDA
jgi:hypothetical protein